ncbi:MAG: response regulator transcription factor [Phycisphaerae bacterium]|nr:response regulator transcription factor [Phycisphaerae bacterium]
MTVTKTLRILIADDHAMMRGALAKWLEDVDNVQVVDAVSNADDALSVAVRERPDIVLMDIDMPGLGCFSAARSITAQSPETSIIFVSAFYHDRYIEQALAVEAAGYVTKSEPPDKLIDAIQTVAAGGVYFSPEVQSRITVDSEGAKLTNPVQTRVSSLTRRELEVVRYIARGMLNKEIAQLMGISAKTVEQHTFHLMTKLDIHNRVELARFAIREGLAEA